jgi:O-antigen ligase
VTTLLVALVVLAFPYIALAVDLPLGPLHLDTPIADLAAAALVPLALLGMSRARPPRLPGLAGYALLVGAGLAALPGLADRGPAAWFLLRKPVFLYVAYGGALAWLVTRELSRRAVRRMLLATVTLASVASLATSVGRIAAGNTLWFASIEGLTNNHKTLAVALAPLVPLLLGLRRSRLDLAVVALALAAISLSLSRTAWIAAVVGLAWFVVVRGRALSARRGLALGVVVVGIAGALYGPLLTGSVAQLDAARSRHSLDKRALEMFESRPILGMGGGANVRFEQQTFPDYRVNGVDAHGAVQKVASEYGVVGLAGYALFVGAMALRLRRRAGPGGLPAGPLAPPDVARGSWATFVALHVNLILSTETFSQTHWVPLALVWGLSWRRRP